jgi:hypothetical protein
VFSGLWSVVSQRPEEYTEKRAQLILFHENSETYQKPLPTSPRHRGGALGGGVHLFQAFSELVLIVASGLFTTQFLKGEKHDNCSSI